MHQHIVDPQIALRSFQHPCNFSCGKTAGHIHATSHQPYLASVTLIPPDIMVHLHPRAGGLRATELMRVQWSWPSASSKLPLDFTISGPPSRMQWWRARSAMPGRSSVNSCVSQLGKQMHVVDITKALGVARVNTGGNGRSSTQTSLPPGKENLLHLRCLRAAANGVLTHPYPFCVPLLLCFFLYFFTSIRFRVTSYFSCCFWCWVFFFLSVEHEPGCTDQLRTYHFSHAGRLIMLRCYLRSSTCPTWAAKWPFSQTTSPRGQDGSAREHNKMYIVASNTYFLWVWL